MLFAHAARSRPILSRILFCAAVAASGHFFADRAMGQSTFGSFVGTVRDPSGAVVPSCVVSLVNKGTSVKRDAVTDATGAYVFVNLEPGVYDIAFQAPGFQRATVADFELLARQTARIDGKLTVAMQSEMVTVSAAEETPINTEVSNIAETKVGRELIDLPLAIASRASGSTSPYSTLTTQPGVQTDNSGNISVAGTKPSMLSMTLDGVSTSNAKTGTPISELFPSFEGIAEIRVSEINNTAEFGGVSDITTISKSGNNTYHGSLFENFQNAFMNARDPFSTTIPKLVMNDYGGSAGGPISVPGLYSGKDRTFFFADYEGLQLPKQSTVIKSIPTEALKTGDLSAYLPKTVVKDPLSPGATFAGNQIPLTRIAPLSLRAMNYFWPDPPNYGADGAIANNYSQNYPTSIVNNQGDLRVDQNITSKQTTFARLTYKRRQSLTTPSGAAVLGGGTSNENDYSISGAHNYIIGPNMVNEVRVGYSGQNNGTVYGYTSQQVVDALGLTLPGPPPAGSASTSFSITGFTNTNGGTTSLSRANVLQALDNLTWTKGRHTIKFGGDYRYQRGLYTNVFASGRMGSYTFNNSSVTKNTIGSPFAAFLLGIPDTTGLTTVQYPDTYGYASHYALYVQDDWKITPRLTLNYGLRWEYHPTYRDHYDNLANFLPDYTSVSDGVTVNGAVVIPDAAVPLVDSSFRASIAPTPILTASQVGLPQSLRYSEKTDFVPRIGFAWRVTPDGKTVIRGGYGRFIEALAGSGINAAWAVEASFVGKYTNAFVDGKPLYTFPHPFPDNLAQPGTESFQLASEIHYQDPYVQQWNFTIERDLGFNTGLRITYDGSHGTDLGVRYNTNQIPANTVGYVAAQATIPFPAFNSISTYGNGGRSNYHAVTVSANRRLSKGLQFQTSYTFARNLSSDGGANPTSFPGESGGSVSDRYNFGIDYGNVAYTRRHRFLTTFLYMTQLQVRNPVLRQLASGWELAGVLLFQTGPFLSVTTSGADPAGINASGTSSTVRADIVPGVPLYPENQSPSSWVNPDAFTVPPNNIGRFGDSPVGAIVGPNTQAVSLSLFRTFPVGEKIRLRLGVAAANALNHPNYGNPALTIGNATFGTITSLQSAEGSGPRAVQLTGRITF
jgi:Carboxypeptidase regulatory-like domain/TonB dependent receptor-like, beta-barrel